MDTASLLLWFASLLCVSALKITQIRVPNTVDLSVHDSAILDCDYEIDNSEGLVVKWFFGEDDEPVYQWIFMHKPQAFGVFKDRLDLDYKASDRNESMYRALSIKDLSLDLTGDYKCVVSTFLEEDTKTKKMIVYVPAKNLEIIQVKPNDETTQIICTAQGISPKPVISIKTAKSIDFEDQEIVETKTKDGLYNITSLLTIKDNSITGSMDFTCEVSIPDTSYTSYVKLTYYPGPFTTTTIEFVFGSNSTNAMTYATQENAGSSTTPITWLCAGSLLLLATSWT